MQNGLRKIFDKVFTRYVSTGFIFAMDVSLTFVAALIVDLAVQYSSSFLMVPDPSAFSWVWLLVSTVSATLMFWLFKSYRIIIRHSSMSDIFRFDQANRRTL